jgi:hypothetical protein
VKLLPAWFPGADFVNIAKAYKTRAEAFSDVPYEFVKQQMKNGSFVPSFLSNLLQSNPVENGTKEENIVKWSAGSLYAGGADTVRTKKFPSAENQTNGSKRLLFPSLVSFLSWLCFPKCSTRPSRNSTK